MSNKPKQYSYANSQIRVSFDGRKCAHAGFCFKELHNVFDGDRDPPIDLNGGPTDAVIRVVEMCPSSALTYERLDGGDNEVAQERATATIIPNGPLALRGELQMDDQGFTRLTLCRCGQSKSKPYCDGSHHHHRFDDQAEVAAEEIAADSKAGAVSLTPYSNGPVGFSGELTINTASGDALCQRSKGGLCRCGASQSKPFCDGSHAKVGFQT